MKLKLALVLVVMLSAIMVVYANTPPHRPFGVASESWVRISDTAGIVVVKREPDPLPQQQGNVPDEQWDALRRQTLLRVDAQLYVLEDNRWTKVTFSRSEGAKFMPLGS